VRQQAFQTWIGDHTQRTPPNYCLIPVKPNWHDSSEVLGYVTRLGLKKDEEARYVATDFVRFLVKAWKTPGTPHWLCLDEMNLAPVEQYFAEYLSVIETRRVHEDGIISDPLLPASVFRELSDADWGRFCDALGLGADSELREKFRKDGIALPQNLIVVGTVNMDETTHSFSRKVLDRAFVWEMPIGDLASSWTKLDYPDSPVEWAPLLATEGSEAKEMLGELDIPWDGHSGVGDAIVSWLGQVNEALANTPFQVSFRVRDELLLLAASRGVATIDNLRKTLDDGLYSKILPRIEGDESRTKKALLGLVKLLASDAGLDDAPNWTKYVAWIDSKSGGDGIDFDLLGKTESGPAFIFDGDDWKSDPFSPARPWRRSLNKLRSMLLKLEGQFTSYWD
jgi:hypothetical protein